MGIFDNLFVWKVQNPPDPSRAPTQKQLREMNSEMGLLNGAIINNKIVSKEEYEAYYKDNPGAKIEPENVRELNDKYAQLKENLKEKIENFDKEKIDTKPVTKTRAAELEGWLKETNIQEEKDHDAFQEKYDHYQEQNPDLSFTENLDLHPELNESAHDDNPYYSSSDKMSAGGELDYIDQKLEGNSEKFRHDFDISASPDTPKYPEIEPEI